MTSPERPGAITAVAICGLSLGLLGLLGSCSGAVSVLVQGPLMEQQADFLEGSAPAGQADMQIEIQRQAWEIQRDWMPFTLTHQFFNFLASTALLVAAVMLLRMNPTGARVFVFAAIGNALVDTFGTAVQVALQQDTMALMSNMMTDITSTADPALSDTMEAMTTASMWVGVCFGGVFLLVKLGFYLIGVLTLRKPAHRDALASAASAG